MCPYRDRCAVENDAIDVEVCPGTQRDVPAVVAVERRFDYGIVPDLLEHAGQERAPSLVCLRVGGVVGAHEPPGSYARCDQLGTGGPVELPGNQLLTLGLRVHDHQCTTAVQEPSLADLSTAPVMRAVRRPSQMQALLVPPAGVEPAIRERSSASGGPSRQLWAACRSFPDRLMGSGRPQWPASGASAPVRSTRGVRVAGSRPPACQPLWRRERGRKTVRLGGCTCFQRCRAALCLEDWSR